MNEEDRSTSKAWSRELAAEFEPGVAERVETHISRVYLGRTAVLKVKKAVDFGFLDFSTLQKREHACHREVELNRRLAPDVYLGVAAVKAAPDGTDVPAPASEPASEWGVLMRRLPRAHCFEQRLQDGTLKWEHLLALAERLARFHRGAALLGESARAGQPSAIEQNVRENFSQAHQLLEPFVSETQQAELEEYQLRTLQQRESHWQRRIELGRIVDGHGDLRLEHVYADGEGRLTVLDCIEFNDRFRYGDAACDVAFLSMDLEFHGRGDLAERFLAAYARAADDFDLYAVIDFYESYRAYVRAKICALSLQQGNLAPPTRRRLQKQARRYFQLSLASARPALSPLRLIAVGGLIASGKSTLSGWISSALPAPTLSSDRTRKSLLGVEPDRPLREAGFSGAYDAATTQAVYAELLRRARVVLASGRSVVLDASFSTRAARASAAQLARELGAEFRFIECRAREPVVARRLQERARGPSESDGRADIYQEFAARYEPPEELPQAKRLTVDTSEGTARASALAWLGLGGAALDPGPQQGDS